MAALTPAHPEHERVKAWLEGVRPVLCPIVELGWLRISTGVYGLEMPGAFRILKDFSRNADFLACDLPAMNATPAPVSGKTTDWYLADLAQKHGLKWATLDRRSNHPAAELIPSGRPPTK
jgi:predicted nucleic acid-binding protein